MRIGGDGHSVEAELEPGPALHVLQQVQGPAHRDRRRRQALSAALPDRSGYPTLSGG